MKTSIVILFVFFLHSCSNKPGPDTAPAKRKINTSLTDTIFLKRVVRDTVYMGITDHAYNAIYIDTNRNSAYYKQLADFSFDKYENLDYYNIEFKKRGIHLKKMRINDLPAEWVPLYLYKNKYYLYAPCDWGNMMRQILTDSLLIQWGMEGPWPYVLNTVKKIDSDTYSIFSKNYFSPLHSTGIPEIINIHFINPERRIAVWEYVSEKREGYRYALFVAKENSKDFDIIVNYSTEKTDEFTFEQPDFVTLLKNKKKKKGETVLNVLQ